MSSPIEVLAIVPLRLQSVRVKKKILEKIGDGKNQRPLCVWVCQKVLRAFDDMPFVKVIAAVDDSKTAEILKKYLPDLKVILTDPSLPSGTDRVFATAREFIVQNLEIESTLKGIINVQGDMPFVAAQGIRELAQFFVGASGEDLARAPMLTLCQEWPREKNGPKLTDSSAVKVILNRESFAIYFSRFPIPYSRNKEGKGVAANLAKFHLGVYGYSKDGLARFCSAQPNPLEKAEGLEQLRALYLGLPILVLPTQPGEGESYRGVDTPADLSWARKFYKENFGQKSTKKAKRK